MTVSTSEEGPVSSAQSFTVVVSGKPSISSLSTNLAATGEEVTISGSGFDPSTSGNVVRLNGAAALVTSATSSAIKFKVPTDRLGGRVSISTPNGSATGPDLFVPPNNAATSTVSETERLQAGEAKTATIISPETDGLLLFDGEAGQQVSVVPSAANFSGSFEVFRPSGSALSGMGGNLNSIHGPVTLPETGTYTVQLEGSATETGSVDLTAYTFSDITESITPTAEGLQRSPTITTPGQAANYFVTADAGDVVTVKSANANFTGEYCLRWLTAAGATFPA
ncbi:MAG TPA: IPT/TIG domain-containing protein, partial [Acidimicrobiia bacterium]|nr:IPT/TIG domain-containing protein [Acidimicrobiia bacterium]